MLIIPAIDIKGGKCVRLMQGDPDRETVYSNDPVSMAKKFEEMGAKLIHIVDLDGAFSGHPVSRDIVIKIAKGVNIPVEVGGGIRTDEAIKAYADAGIRRIILGTAVIDGDLRGIIEHFSDFVVIGVDAKDSMVATHGWKNTSKVFALDFIKELKKNGLKEIIYTDISTDGMLTGPNYRSIRTILSEVKGINLIASGGVSSIDDIMRFREYQPMGLKGCIVGKAVYDGRLDLREAIDMFRDIEQ
jgi:phosphoribosylformimino-5-aminoimidazole carboxamide ribotide isomerase